MTINKISAVAMMCLLPAVASAGTTNSCTEVSATAGCIDPGIETSVCLDDPYCCAEQGMTWGHWDSYCVDEAQMSFYAEQSCLEANPTPECGDPDVTECVCAADSFCCAEDGMWYGTWDDICADLVTSLSCDTQGGAAEAPAVVPGPINAEPDCQIPAGDYFLTTQVAGDEEITYNLRSEGNFNELISGNTGTFQFFDVGNDLFLDMTFSAQATKSSQWAFGCECFAGDVTDINGVTKSWTGCLEETFFPN